MGDGDVIYEWPKIFTLWGVVITYLLFQKFDIKWGSEIRTSPDFEW